MLARETRVDYLRQKSKESSRMGRRQASDEKDSEVVQSGGVGMVRVGVWIRTETTLMDVVGGVQ